MSNKKRLFVDMDGTLAEWRSFKYEFSSLEEVQNANSLIYQKLNEEDYFYKLKPQENVVNAIKEIIEKNDDIEVFILSAVISEKAIEDKNRWLDKYLPELDHLHRVFTEDGKDKKEFIVGGVKSDDYLLDDRTLNLSLWQPPARGIKLLNGLNHTTGTWKDDMLNFEKNPQVLAKNIIAIMNDGVHIRDDLPHNRTQTIEIKPITARAFEDIETWENEKNALSEQYLKIIRDEKFKALEWYTDMGGHYIFHPSVKDGDWQLSFIDHKGIPTSDSQFKDENIGTGKRWTDPIEEFPHSRPDKKVTIRALFNNLSKERTIMEELNRSNEDMIISKQKEQLIPRYAVLQLANGKDENRYKRFESLDAISDMGLKVQGEDYEMVYFDTYSPNEKQFDLEELYIRFNSNGLRPSNYYGHSLSVSDVILVSENGVDVKCFYCDRMGYSELDGSFINAKINDRFNTGTTVREEFDLLTEIDNNDSVIERINYLKEEYHPIFEMADKRKVFENEFIANTSNYGGVREVTHGEESLDKYPVGKDGTGIKIEGHIGSWSVIDSKDYEGEKLFLLEHETYGDEAPSLIVDKNGVVKLDDVYNGFSDYDELLENNVEFMNDEHHNPITSLSLEERYAKAMTMAGYELIDGNSGGNNLNAVSFRIVGSDRITGYDNWMLVGNFLENVVLPNQEEALAFNNLIHPQGRIQYATEMLDGDFFNNEVVTYPNLETALKAYKDAGEVDGKAIGFKMDGQNPSLNSVVVAQFSAVDMSNHVGSLQHIKSLVPNATINEIEEIEKYRNFLLAELTKSNDLSRTEEQHSDIVLHIKYKEPIVINGWKGETDTITFDNLDELEKFVRGDVAYDVMDNSIRKKDNEILLFAEDKKGVVVWSSEEKQGSEISDTHHSFPNNEDMKSFVSFGDPQLFSDYVKEHENKSLSVEEARLIYDYMDGHAYSLGYFQNKEQNGLIAKVDYNNFEDFEVSYESIDELIDTVSTWNYDLIQQNTETINTGDLSDDEIEHTEQYVEKLVADSLMLENIELTAPNKENLIIENVDKTEVGVKFFVAECMEFHNLGAIHEDITTIEEAIKIYNNLQPSRKSMGNGIGVIINNWEYSLYANGDIDTLEYYSDDIKNNIEIKNAIKTLTHEFDKSANIQVDIDVDLENKLSNMFGNEISEKVYEYINNNEKLKDFIRDEVKSLNSSKYKILTSDELYDNDEIYMQAIKNVLNGSINGNKQVVTDTITGWGSINLLTEIQHIKGAELIGTVNGIEFYSRSDNPNLIMTYNENYHAINEDLLNVKDFCRRVYDKYYMDNQDGLTERLLEQSKVFKVNYLDNKTTHREETPLHEDNDLSKPKPERSSKMDVENKENELSAKDQVMQQLEEGIKGILDSEKFADWCKKQGRLYYNNYSFRNAMLTYIQKPDASYVSGYEAWKEYGRQVKQGAKGIKILAPSFVKEYGAKGSLLASIKKACNEQFKKDSTLEYANFHLGQSKLSFNMYKNGLFDVKIGDVVKMAHITSDDMRKFLDQSVIGKTPAYYNAITVFDVADTTTEVEFLWLKDNFKKEELALDDNGNAIKNKKGQFKIINTEERKARFNSEMSMTIQEADTEKMEILFDTLKNISEKKGIPLTVEDPSKDSTLSDGALGYYRRSQDGVGRGNIVISSELSITNQVSVAFHEIAHSDLHFDVDWLKDEMDLDAGDRITRQMKETQAEAVAFMTASNFGIETEHKSFEYIAHWSDGRDLKALEQSLDVIYKESKKLMNDIEKELDTKGLTLSLETKDTKPLSVEQKNPVVTEYKEFVLSETRTNETLQKNAFDDFKNLSDGTQKAIVKEQISLTHKIEEKISGLNDKVDKYEKSENRQEQTVLQYQMKADVSKIKSLQSTLNDLSEERVAVVREKSDKEKTDMKALYTSNPLKAMELLQKDNEKMKELSDSDLKYLATSKFVSREFSKYIGVDNQKFIDLATKQLDNLKEVMSKSKTAVEVAFCEQWGDKPIFEAGTVAHPKVANKIFLQAEKQTEAFKLKAEKENDYYPYTKCDITVYSMTEKNKLTALNTRIDIGDGEQKDLSDHLSQVCARGKEKQMVLENFTKATKERTGAKLLTPYSIENTKEIEKIRDKGEVENIRSDSTMSMDTWKAEIKDRLGNDGSKGDNSKEQENAKERE